MQIDQYRIMWVLVFFDLPTETKAEKRAYFDFRKNLLKDGFEMFQFSIYLRHCMSQENADVHTNRVKTALPAKGKVGILRITDKQFGSMDLFEGSDSREVIAPPQQLEFF